MPDPDQTPEWGVIIASNQIARYSGGIISRTEFFELLKVGEIEGVKFGRLRGGTRRSIDKAIERRIERRAPVEAA